MIFTNSLLTMLSRELYEYLAERFEEDNIDELKDEGYVYDDPKTEAEFINKIDVILS